MSDNYLTRYQDEQTLAKLVADIETLKAQMEGIRPAEMYGTYLSYFPRATMPFSTTTAMADAVLPKNYGGLLGFGAAIFVDTTNNASHYWKIELTTSASVLIASVSTQGFAANTWLYYFTNTVINTPPATDHHWHIIATKVGSPGVVYPVPFICIL